MRESRNLLLRYNSFAGWVTVSCNPTQTTESAGGENKKNWGQASKKTGILGSGFQDAKLTEGQGGVVNIVN